MRGYSCVGRSLIVTARTYPGKLAVVEIDGLSLTYAELNFRVNQFADLLLARGLKKGDHVALLLSNTVEHILCLYAIAKIGGVVVAFEPRWTPREIAKTLAFFDCSLLIMEDAFQEKMIGVDPNTLRYGLLTVTRPSRETSGLFELIAARTGEEPGVEVFDDDVFTMLLTSGTTGMPKGCIRSHRNVEVGCIKDSLGRRQDDRSRELVVAPMHYGSGRGSVLGQIFLGGTIYLMDSFNAKRVAECIERQAITDIALAPTMCRRLLELPNLDRHDFSSLKALRKVGSPFHVAMTTQLIERITKNVYQGFASTESGGATMLKPYEQLMKPGSSGRPRWGVEVEIVDSERVRPLPPGQEGEIRIRSANVCQGYYKNPEEQAKAFRDGWYHTGDLGVIDADGFLYVRGRLKELIKTGSINVAPREVENTILMMEGVKDVAVLGIPDAEWGEAIKAFVVPEDNTRLSATDITLYCRQSLAGFKVPKFVEFISGIERNALGKITAEFKAAAIAGSIKSTG